MRLIDLLTQHPLLDTEISVNEIYKPLGFEIHMEFTEAPIDEDGDDAAAVKLFSDDPEAYMATLGFFIPEGFVEVARFDTEDSGIVLLALKPLTPLAELLLAQEETGEALASIARERRRQVEAEGWSGEKDGLYPLGVLASAGQAYLTAYRFQQLDLPMVRPSAWPWDATWWKPSNHPTRNLEKAGALTLAEMERLARAEQRQGGGA